MKKSLKKWVLGFVAIGLVLSFLACEQQPAMQPQMKSKAPDLGAIANVDGDSDKEQKPADNAAPRPAASLEASSSTAAAPATPPADASTQK